MVLPYSRSMIALCREENRVTKQEYSVVLTFATLLVSDGIQQRVYGYCIGRGSGPISLDDVRWNRKS